MKRIVLAVAAVSMLGTVAMAAGECVDHKILDGVLKANVDPDGFVNYNDIRINKGGNLYEYLSFVEVTDLSNCSEQEKLAFWINAYNANMIAQVLAHPQMKKVSEDFALFNRPLKVAKLKVSLNDIEHRIIRSSAKNGGPIPGVSLAKLDPRVHFALVCAAIDCPRLLNRAYSAKTLEETLQANAVHFANTPKHLRIENGKLVVTNLVKWYSTDFDKMGGVPAYLTSLIDKNQRADADQIIAALKEYPANAEFVYDWTVNSVANKPKAAAPAK